MLEEYALMHIHGDRFDLVCHALAQQSTLTTSRNKSILNALAFVDDTVTLRVVSRCERHMLSTLNQQESAVTPFHSHLSHNSAFN
jgi:hypothetical protein